MKFVSQEHYELDLEGDMWALYRQEEGDPSAYLILESYDLNSIFLAMYKDKASRGHGSSMIIA